MKGVAEERENDIGLVKRTVEPKTIEALRQRLEPAPFELNGVSALLISTVNENQFRGHGDSVAPQRPGTSVLAKTQNSVSGGNLAAGAGVEIVGVAIQANQVRFDAELCELGHDLVECCDC